jgi:peptide/nickel transport system permease protein
VTVTPSLQPAPLDDAAFTPATPVARSNWQLFRRRFFRHKLAWVSLAILTVLIIGCFGAKWLAPHPQGAQDFLASNEGPSLAHPFGTDDLGRDQLSEIMYAGQISLMIGFFVALLSTIVGVTVGAVAAYFGRVTDQGLSSVVDLFLILPDLALLALAIENFGNGSTSIILVLAALGWMSMARVIRGQVLSLKEKEYVEAAKASGASTSRIVVRHILPNTVGTIMVNATLAVAGAIGTEAALSFLGFGIQPPQNSWGRMLSDAQAYSTNPDKFYLVFFPGFMLVVTLLAVNFLGDALRDAFDPQSAH